MSGVKFQTPVEIRDGDERYYAKDFRQYVRYMQLPEPTRVVMSDEVNTLVTALVNAGKVTPREALKAGEYTFIRQDGSLAERRFPDYQFDDDGFECIEYPGREEMLQRLQLRFPKRRIQDPFVQEERRKLLEKRRGAR